MLVHIAQDVPVRNFRFRLRSGLFLTSLTLGQNHAAENQKSFFFHSK